MSGRGGIIVFACPLFGLGGQPALRSGLSTQSREGAGTGTLGQPPTLRPTKDETIDVKWLLMAQLCSSVTAKCEWRQLSVETTERRCILRALEIAPDLQFRCQEVRRTAAVPLPKPRPVRPFDIFFHP